MFCDRSHSSRFRSIHEFFSHRVTVRICSSVRESFRIAAGDVKKGMNLCNQEPSLTAETLYRSDKTLAAQSCRQWHPAPRCEKEMNLCDYKHSPTLETPRHIDKTQFDKLTTNNHGCFHHPRHRMASDFEMPYDNPMV